MYSEEFQKMKWLEFKTLLAGLGPETPLGRIVSIRAEEDEDILKHFTKGQRRIRNEWLKRKAEQVTSEELDDVLEQLKNAFVRMAGGEVD